MKTKNSKTNFALIMAVYLLGIFMGAIDTGIVTPARTVIQNFLGVDDKTGIWMITMYTLAYAASIPIMGKLADKYGRKYIYIISISLFGLGSLFCGLSQSFGSFGILLAARAVQAIGGGGIVPIATAEFGTTFPKEKRGMALGLVGGVYGIANIFGSSAGSLILDIFGTNNWQYIFYINVPITIFIVVAGLISLPNTKIEKVKKTDYAGITILTVMVLSLLYGLKNIDFFEFTDTITKTNVYPFLILFAVLLPVFIFAEKKAEDPVMNLSFFQNGRIIITLILSFATGFVLMGMIFVPQFSENALKVASGDGGYFVIILGLFAGVGAPISGKLIDKYGVRLVLGFGFLISALGAMYLVLVTTNYPNIVNVIVSLILVGLGIGFTMGTPLNYMMLDNTKKEEANSALAAVSLIRSVGTAIAPAIMIGFISHAGMNLQGNVMALLPGEVSVPELPYAQELSDKLDELKADPAMADKLAGVDMPDLAAMQTVKFNMNSTDSSFKMPQELIDQLRASDVTTITETLKAVSSYMFDLMTPDVIEKINSGLQSGIDAMTDASTGMDQGIAGMQSAIDAQKGILVQLNDMYDKMSAMSSMAAMPGAAEGTTGMPGATPVDGTDTAKATGMPAGMTDAAGGAPMDAASFSILDMIPEAAKASIPEEVLTQLSEVKTADDLKAKIDELQAAVDQLTAQQTALSDSKAEMTDMIDKMTKLKAAVPDAFSTAKTTYLSEIDALKAPIETEFQDTLNIGFRQVYLTVTITASLAFILLMFYRKKKEEAI